MSSRFVSRRSFLRGVIAAGTGLAASPLLAGVTSVQAGGRTLAAVPLEASPAAQILGGSQLPVSVPRNQVYVVDQIFRYSVANNFNLFVPGGPPSPTRQGLVMDTLWYIDQES